MFLLVVQYLCLAVSSAEIFVYFSTFIIALQNINRDTSYVKRFLNHYDRIW